MLGPLLGENGRISLLGICVNQTAPATIFNDLMERAVEYLQGRPVSEMEIKRFEREVKALEKANTAGMYELRAFIAAIQRDFDEMHALYGRAFTLTNDYTGAVVRYLNLLSGSARTDDLIEKYREYGNSIRGNIGALRAVEGALLFGGWCETAAQLTEQLEKMGADPLKDIGHYPVDVDRDEGVSEADVAHVIGFVHEYLISRGYRAQSVMSTRIPQDDGSSRVLFQLSIKQPPAVVSDLEWDLFAAMEQANLAAEKAGFLRVALTSR